MQIQHTQAIQSSTTPQANSTSVTTNTAKPAAEKGLQVSISNHAQQLAKDNVSAQNAEIQPIAGPTDPQTPLTGEQLDKAVQIKKAQLHYNMASEMANIVNGADSNDGVSVAITYLFTQNEDAREVALDAKSQQQNMQNMQAYQEQTATLNEQYS